MGSGQVTLSSFNYYPITMLIIANWRDCGFPSGGVKLLFALSPFERLGRCRLPEVFILFYSWLLI